MLITCDTIEENKKINLKLWITWIKFVEKINTILKWFDNGYNAVRLDLEHSSAPTTTLILST